MSGSYRDGIDEGLRVAAEIIRALETAVNERLEKGSASTLTRDARRTRAQAYRNAESRIETRLRARRRGVATADAITKNLSRLGL